MLYVVCYDVSNDKARRRVADLLEEHAVRVQDSVFELRGSAAKAQTVAAAAARFLDEGDSLRVYALTETGRRHSFAYGASPLPEAEDFLLV